MNDFQNKLDLAILAWSQRPIVDEWAFAKFRDETISIMPPPEAFDAIGVVVAAILENPDYSAKSELLQTAIDLAIQSCTTEIPGPLSKDFEKFKGAFSECDDYTKEKLKEFLRIYRISVV